MSDLDFLSVPAPTRAPDNADPHPVILTVHPREWRIPFAHQWEAEYEIEVQHPATCSAYEEDCPVEDYLLNVGIDRDVYAGFPEPDDLTDEELAALNGTVRYVTITRASHHYSGPEGDDYDCTYDFAWSDTDAEPPSRRTAVRYALMDLAISCQTRKAEWTRPRSSPDLSDLYERALDRIEGLYSGVLAPAALLEQIDGPDADTDPFPDVDRDDDPDSESGDAR